MKELQEKRRIKKMIYSKTSLIILVFLVVFLIKPTWGVYNKMKESSTHLDNLNERVQNLRDREEFLLSEVERLHTERGIEEEIRRKFGLAKEGERMVIINENSDFSINDDEVEDLNFINKLQQKTVNFFR